jgi:glycine/D-amino acid oxidase-like deaminating enzyme
VIERDPAYARASSSLSASSIRMQFSTAVNIELSRWSLQFLRRIGSELAVGGDAPPAIGLVEPGYLYLAAEAGVAALQARQAFQSAQGADIAWLCASGLKQRFGWLQTDDLAGGALGLSTDRSGEGWFDGPALADAFRRKARACGVRFMQGDVAGFATAGDLVRGAQLADGSSIAADAFVLCGGAWSAALGAMLGTALPVHAKKRDVFVFDTPAALPACPLLIDPSGCWLRPEGRGFLCGAPPREPWPGDPDEPPLDTIDHALFDELIWPTLAHRVPALQALRLRSAWAGYYEMNAFDHNGLAGALPGWRNAYTACGFSGHGMQQAPAVGAALAALVAGAQVDDLAAITALSPQRVLDGLPLREDIVI